MHRALQFPDILTIILENCTTESIARAACVCRSWEKVANDKLWRNVSNVWTLLQLLGPLEDGERGTVRSRITSIYVLCELTVWSLDFLSSVC